MPVNYHTPADEPQHHEHHHEHAHTPEQPGAPVITRRGFVKKLILSLGLGSVLGISDADAAASPDKSMTHHEEVKKYWKQEQEMFDAINKQGWQKYVDSLKDIREGFFPVTKEGAPVHTPCGCCIDEGIRSVEDDNGEKLHLVRSAGSDILNVGGIEGFDPETYDPMDDAYIEAVARKHNALGITVESYHFECGAGRLAYGKHHKLSKEQLEKVSDDTIAAFCKQWTYKLIEKRKELLRKEGKDKEADALRARFIQFEEMDRPPHLHIPRVVYYDGTGRLDGSYRKLPQGFIVSRMQIGKETAKGTTDVAKKIDFGPHGPGDLLNEDEPLVIVCVGVENDPSRNSETLIAEVNDWLKSLPASEQKRIRIESFTPQLEQAA